MKTTSHLASRFLFAAVLTLLAAFGLRVYQLDAQSLWYDEAYSILLASRSFVEATRWTARDVVPPLYYYLLHFWMLLGGTTEFAVRLLSVLIGLLALPFAFRIGIRLSHPRAGLLAMGLLAVSPLYVWHAQDARMYMLLTTLSVISLWALTMILTTGPAGGRPGRWRRWWVIWGVVLLAMIYTHTIAVFLVAAQMLILACFAIQQRRVRRLWSHAVVVGLTLVGLYAPWLWIARREYEVNAGYFPGILSPQQVFLVTLQSYATGGVFIEPPPEMVTALVSVLLVIAFVGLLLYRERGQDRPLLSMPARAFYLLALLLLPILFMAIVFYQVPKFAARYTFAMSPPFFLLLAFGLSALARHWQPAPAGRRGLWLGRAAGAIGILLLFAVFLAGTRFIHADPRIGKEDFRGAARYIERNIQPDETVLLLSGHFFPVWDYYYPGDWTPLPELQILDLNHTINFSIADRLNRALDGKRGAWVVLWQDEVIDPNGFVRMMLDRNGVLRHHELGFRNVELWHYRFEEPPRFSSQPDFEQPLNVRFGNGIELIGYRQDGSEVTVFWKAREKMAADYQVALRLRDEDGGVWGTADQRPTTYLYPTSYWKKGELLFGRYPIPADPGTPPGDYRLSLSVYDPSKDEPVNVVDEQARVLGVWYTLPVMLNQRWEREDVAGTLAEPMDRSMNESLRLLDARVESSEVLGGAPVVVELLWEVMQPLSDGYRVRFDLVAGSQTEPAGSVTRPLAPHYPASEWQVGEVVRERYRVAAPPDGGSFDLQLRLVDGSGDLPAETVSIGNLNVEETERNFEAPSPERLSDTRFGDAITLIGADVSRTAVQPGDTVRLALYWRSEATTDRNLTVFTHLTRKNGEIITQDDRIPADGQKPTHTWVPSEIITDEHAWTIPADTEPGTYQIRVGLYDAGAENLPRVPVAGAGSDEASDSAVLGTLEVLP